MKGTDMNKLIQYMRLRAAYENVKWELTENDLLPYFTKGIRNFFGVVVDDFGNIVNDEQQPSFFFSYKSASVN